MDPADLDAEVNITARAVEVAAEAVRTAIADCEVAARRASYTQRKAQAAGKACQVAARRHYRALHAKRAVDAAQLAQVRSTFVGERTRRKVSVSDHTRARLAIGKASDELSVSRARQERAEIAAEAASARLARIRSELKLREAEHQTSLAAHHVVVTGLNANKAERLDIVVGRKKQITGHRERTQIRLWDAKAVRLRDSAVAALRGIDVARYSEEWQADMDALPPGWPRFRWALSLRFRAPRQIRRSASVRTLPRRAERWP